MATSGSAGQPRQERACGPGRAHDILLKACVRMVKAGQGERELIADGTRELGGGHGEALREAGLVVGAGRRREVQGDKRDDGGRAHGGRRTSKILATAALLSLLRNISNMPKRRVEESPSSACSTHLLVPALHASCTAACGDRDRDQLALIPTKIQTLTPMVPQMKQHFNKQTTNGGEEGSGWEASPPTDINGYVEHLEAVNK